MKFVNIANKSLSEIVSLFKQSRYLLSQFVMEPISCHLEWSFTRFVSLLFIGMSFLESSTSDSTKIWSLASDPKGLLSPSQNMTISNWMMAIIKYENQLSVMSFPNVTSKTADAKPNPTTSNIVALMDVSYNSQRWQRYRVFLWSVYNIRFRPRVKTASSKTSKNSFALL